MSPTPAPLAETDPSAGPLPSAAPLRLVPIAVAEWDRVAVTLADVAQEQLAVFAANRWPGVSLEPVVFEADGRRVGGCLVMIQRLPLGLASMAVIKWGPMRQSAEEPEDGAVYRGMIEALIAEYAERRGMMLSVLPHSAFAATPSRQYDWLLQRGFRAGANLPFPNRYLVNLRLSDAELRASFEQKWRYHLNKSEKAGLAFRHVEATELPRFRTLYEAMLNRKAFADHSAYDGTLEAMMAIPDPALRPELFLVDKAGELVAGAVIFKAGHRAVYLYGATSDAALALRAGYFMHWHIIRWLRDNTAAGWYDLGGTDGFQGLHQFKKGMVGSRGLIPPLPPVANYSAHLWPRLVGEAAFAAREWMHRGIRLVERLKPGKAKPDQQRAGEAE